MKAIETLTYQGKVFAVLVETKQDDEVNGYIHYFIDGTEITDYSRLLKTYQRMFTVMADNLCQGHGLIKYSY